MQIDAMEKDEMDTNAYLDLLASLPDPDEYFKPKPPPELTVEDLMVCSFENVFVIIF